MEDARIRQLEQRVAELAALVERLAPAAVSALAPTESATPLVPEVVAPDDTAEVSSRRGILKLAGAAAVGVVTVAVVGNATPAAAATGDPMKIGVSNSASIGDVTTLFGALVAFVDSGNGFELGGPPSYGGAVSGWNTASNVDANVRAGVLGISSPFLSASGPQTGHGVLGLANGPNTTGSGVYGNSTSTVTSSAGVLARSTGGPSVQLVPVAAGAPTAGAWTIGTLQPDTAGNLWYCIASGTPGSWRNLTAPASPSFHPLTPTRVYDSRAAAPAQGVLSSGANRLVSVASGRTLDTGADNSRQRNPSFRSTQKRDRP